MNYEDDQQRDQQQGQQQVPNQNGIDEDDLSATDDEYDDHHGGLPEYQIGGGNSFDRIIGMLLEGRNRWEELLQVVYRVEDKKDVIYAARKLYPRSPKNWKGVHNIWLAMKRSRFEELEGILRPKVHRKGNDAVKKSCKSWNVLDLASFSNRRPVLKWLLRSHRWTKAQKEHAKSLLQDASLLPPTQLLWVNRLREDPIWDAPFIRHGRMIGHDFRYPNKVENLGKSLQGFPASIVDFYTHDKRLDFVCESSEVFRLLYNGNVSRPQAHMDDIIQQLAGDSILPELNVYHKNNLSFRWIHLPANCLDWMKDTTITCYLDKHKRKEEFANKYQFLLQSWHELPENVVEGRYMSPKCLRNVSSLDNNERSMKSGGELALYMPYITFGSLNTNDHENKLIKHYEKPKTIIHKSRTLDEYFHGPTAETKKRDLDQVVTRWINEKRKTASTDILRVDQLWLWATDDKTIISCGTQRADGDNDPIFEGILNRLSNAQEDLETIPSSVDGFVKFITSFYINALDNLSIDVSADSEGSQRTSIHEIFASSIEKNNEHERILREDFETQMNRKQGTSDDTDTKKEKLGTAGENQNFHDAIVKALHTLTDIKDIRDELNIMTSVVQTQKAVWSQLFNQSSEQIESSEMRQEAKQIYPWMNTDPSYVLSRISDLLRYAEATQKNIESILDLRMNQLSLHEAEESRKQGQTLMVFTIVTVIFLPLSFLSSLFALNVAIFPHSGDDLLYQPGWIFGIIFGTTIGFVALVLLVVKIYEGKFRWVLDETRKYTNWTKNQRRAEPQQNAANPEKHELPENSSQTVVEKEESPIGASQAAANNIQPTTAGEATDATTEQQSGQNNNNIATQAQPWYFPRFRRHRVRNPQTGGV